MRLRGLGPSVNATGPTHRRSALDKACCQALVSGRPVGDAAHPFSKAGQKLRALQECGTSVVQEGVLLADVGEYSGDAPMSGYFHDLVQAGVMGGSTGHEASAK